MYSTCISDCISSILFREVCIYTLLSDFKDVPKAPPPNDTFTYVDSASLRPSWQPKKSRIGNTSQLRTDPFFGNSQQDQSTAL